MRDEGDQGRNADDDARHHDGDIDQRIEERAQPARHAFKAQGRHRAEHR